MNGSTVKGQVLTTFGGVARNVADCLMRLGQQVLFISAVGDDFYGHFVCQDNPQLHESGTDRLKGESTAVCSIILDDTRECVAVVADMKIHQLITPQTIARHEKDVTRAPIVVMDGNIPIETMKCIFDTCQQTGVPVWFEPTDVSQTVKMFGRCEEMWKTICYASPNFNELRAMHSAAFGPPSSQVIDGESMDDVDGLLKKCVVLADPFMEHIQTLVITLGHHGVLLVTTADHDRPFPLRGQRTSKREKLHATYFPLIRRQERVVSVSGAGDCLAGAVIGAVLRRETPERCVRAGLRAAQMSILSHESVPATVDRSSIYAEADDIQTWRPVPIDSL